MIKQFLRPAASAVLLAVVVLIGLSESAAAQEKVHFMNLFVLHHSNGETECVSDPPTLRVGAGDLIIFNAKGRNNHVNHIRWNKGSQDQMPPMEKRLSKDLDSIETEFGPDRPFQLKVNPDITETTAFVLDVECGNAADGPPVIIVDP